MVEVNRGRYVFISDYSKLLGGSWIIWEAFISLNGSHLKLLMKPLNFLLSFLTFKFGCDRLKVIGMRSSLGRETAFWPGSREAFIDDC